MPTWSDLELIRDRIGSPPREPGRAARVATRPEQILLGGDGQSPRGEDEPVSQRRLDRLDRQRAHHFLHSFQRAMAARRHDQPIAGGPELAQALGELGGVSLCGAPVRQAEVDALRERREMEPNPIRRRLVERVNDGWAGPAESLRQRRRFRVRLASAILGPFGLRDDHPGPGREDLGRSG